MNDTDKILQAIAGLTQKVDQQGKVLTGLTATVGTVLEEQQAQRIDIRSLHTDIRFLHDELHATKEELKSEILSSRAEAKRNTIDLQATVSRKLNRLRKKEGRAQYYFMKHGRMEIECLHDLSWSIENCATSVRSGLFPQPVKSLTRSSVDCGSGRPSIRPLFSLRLCLAAAVASAGGTRDIAHGYQDKGAVEEECGAGSVASPSWPGVSA